jgi:predicted nuclease of predicted toxin-antitoxin system
MSVGLYLDVHVPLAITRGLRRRGVEVITAQEDGAARLPDPELLDRASARGLMLFSQDEDLVAGVARTPKRTPSE